MNEAKQISSTASEYNFMEAAALDNVKGMHQDNSLFTIQSVAVVSIAISLKRIADAVSGVPYDSTPGADNTKHSMGLTDGIMHAIEQGLLSASQRG